MRLFLEFFYGLTYKNQEVFVFNMYNYRVYCTYFSVIIVILFFSGCLSKCDLPGVRCSSMPKIKTKQALIECLDDEGCVVVDSIQGLDYIPMPLPWGKDVCGCMTAASINVKHIGDWNSYRERYHSGEINIPCDITCKPIPSKEKPSSKCVNNTCALVKK